MHKYRYFFLYGEFVVINRLLPDCQIAVHEGADQNNLILPIMFKLSKIVSALYRKAFGVRNRL